jgi:hypothetical protein
MAASTAAACIQQQSGGLQAQWTAMTELAVNIQQGGHVLPQMPPVLINSHVVPMLSNMQLTCCNAYPSFTVRKLSSCCSTELMCCRYALVMSTALSCLLATECWMERSRELHTTIVRILLGLLVLKDVALYRRQVNLPSCDKTAAMLADSLPSQSHHTRSAPKCKQLIQLPIVIPQCGP